MLAKLKNKLITDLSINIYICSDLFNFGSSGLKKFTVAEVTRNFWTPLVLVVLLSCSCGHCRRSGSHWCCCLHWHSHGQYQCLHSRHCHRSCCSHHCRSPRSYYCGRCCHFRHCLCFCLRLPPTSKIFQLFPPILSCKRARLSLQFCHNDESLLLLSNRLLLSRWGRCYKTFWFSKTASNIETKLTIALSKPLIKLE